VSHRLAPLLGTSTPGVRDWTFVDEIRFLEPLGLGALGRSKWSSFHFVRARLATKEPVAGGAAARKKGHVGDRLSSGTLFSGLGPMLFSYL